MSGKVIARILSLHVDEFDEEMVAKLKTQLAAAQTVYNAHARHSETMFKEHQASRMTEFLAIVRAAAAKQVS